MDRAIVFVSPAGITPRRIFGVTGTNLLWLRFTPACCWVCMSRPFRISLIVPSPPTAITLCVYVCVCECVCECVCVCVCVCVQSMCFSI